MNIHINEFKPCPYVHIRSVFIEQSFVSLKIFSGLIRAEKCLNTCNVGEDGLPITGNLFVPASYILLHSLKEKLVSKRTK